MFGQFLPEQANAPDSATAYGFAELVTGTLSCLLSHQLIPILGRSIKGPRLMTQIFCPEKCSCRAIRHG